MNHKFSPCPLCGSEAVDESGHYSDIPSNYWLVSCSNIKCPMHIKTTFGGAWETLSLHYQSELLTADQIQAIEQQFAQSLKAKQVEVDELEKRLKLCEELIDTMRPFVARLDLGIINRNIALYDELRKNGG